VSLWPHTHWRQSRKDIRHLDDKVDQVGDNADRDKLSNLSCCLFVAKTGDKSQPYRQQSRPYWRQSILSPVCRRRLVTFAKKCAVYKSTYFLTYLLCCRFQHQSILSPMCTGLYADNFYMSTRPDWQTETLYSHPVRLSFRPSVCASIHSSITKLVNMKTNQPILMEIGTSGPRVKGMKQSTLGSEVKVTQC